MQTFSLSSFLKICLLDPTRQVSEVQKKLSSSGGYDYYRTLTLAIHAKAQGRSEDEIVDILESPSSPAEQLRNTSAYNAFVRKYGAKNGLSVFTKPRTVSPKDGNFLIKIAPTFSIETQSSSKVYAIWAMQTPPMTPAGGALACYIMKNAYRKTSSANSEFFIEDLVGRKAYSEKQIKNSTALTFSSVVQTISRLIDQCS